MQNINLIGDAIIAFIILGIMEAVVKPLAIAAINRPLNVVKPKLKQIYDRFDQSVLLIDNDPIQNLSEIIHDETGIDISMARAIASKMLKPENKEIGFDPIAFVEKINSAKNKNFLS